MRVVEHHDVADLRLADPVGQLVDDQPILIRERRRHALAFDARDLEAERDDERRVDGSRGQRLEPGHQLFDDALDARRRFGRKSRSSDARSPPAIAGSGLGRDEWLRRQAERLGGHRLQRRTPLERLAVQVQGSGAEYPAAAGGGGA